MRYMHVDQHDQHADLHANQQADLYTNQHADLYTNQHADLHANQHAGQHKDQHVDKPEYHVDGQIDQLVDQHVGIKTSSCKTVAGLHVQLHNFDTICVSTNVSGPLE